MRLEEAIIAADDDLLEPCSLVAAYSRTLEPDDRSIDPLCEWILVLKLSPEEVWRCHNVYLRKDCSEATMVSWLSEYWYDNARELVQLIHNNAYCDLDYKLYTIPEMLRRNRQILEELT